MKAGSQIVWGGFPGAIAPGSLYQLRMGGTTNEAATAPTIAPTMTKMRTVFTAPLCHAQAGEGSLRAVLRDQPPRDARREGHDGDLRVHPDAGGEEARVDHVDAAHAAHGTPAVGRAPRGVTPHARRPHGMKPGRLEHG